MVVVHNSIHLTTSFIFFILVLTAILKFYANFGTTGVDLIYELNVILERLAGILNFKSSSNMN